MRGRDTIPFHVIDYGGVGGGKGRARGAVNADDIWAIV